MEREKCKVRVGDRIGPRPGSARIVGQSRTGTCPECDTPGIPLSGYGLWIRSHVISSEELPENNPQPPTLVEAKVKYGAGLSERQVGAADHDGQPGDPSAALKRRTADIHGAYETGTVKVPVRQDNGRTKLTEVPGTEGNVRKALDYWLGRKPRTDASRARQSEQVSLLTRRLEAFRQGRKAMHADVSPEGKKQHALPGPALVKGPNMAPKQRMWRNPVTGQTEPAAAYLDGSLNERLDRTVADERPRARWSKSQRSNYRRKQRRAAQRRGD